MSANTHDDRIAVPISEACRISGIGRSKLYEMIKTGDVRIAKVGRRSLVLIQVPESAAVDEGGVR